MKNSEVKATENKYQDPLTGLPNRTVFYSRLSLALALARRNEKIIAVMFISVDNIKLINDTLGQGCGDLMLKVIAKQITDSLRKSDTVARPGRNEFMVLLPEISYAEDVAKVARKIFTLLEAPSVVEKHELFLSVSIGISVFPNDGDDGETLIRNAYTAMNRAREMGKNIYVFYSQNMNVRAFNRMIMENNLRLALRREEFIMHYQPQIDLCTGRITGMEALVRWNKPSFGIVYPGEFIHLMEETGLIVDLGEWTLKSACAQNKKWQEAGLRHVRVSVNLSGCQFHQHDITKTIRRVLEETRLDPTHLELELTESVFMPNTEAAVEALKTLRGMGVHLSIDDFGTGYSSLSYLKHFPVNRLKMVTPFISAIAVATNEAAIAKAIVDMAHSLNMRVIAEGVELMEDLGFIYSLGCDEAQGNLFTCAVSAEEMTKFISEEKLFSPLNTPR